MKKINDLMDLDWIEKVEDKLVERIVEMGWRHSIEYGDMHLFEKEIDTRKVRLRVTCMSHTFAGIESFTDSIDKQCSDFDEKRIRDEIEIIIDECEKIIKKEKRKFKTNTSNCDNNVSNQVNYSCVNKKGNFEFIEKLKNKLYELKNVMRNKTLIK